MTTYEARRLENIKRNAALIHDLELEQHSIAPAPQPHKSRPVKRRKLETGQATRTSKRIANASTRPNYNEDAQDARKISVLQKGATARTRKAPETQVKSPTPESGKGKLDLDAIRAGWVCWTPTEPIPTQDEFGTYHFSSHPAFTPNKSPEEIIREGCFGGSYWRPLYSKYLRTTVEGDWTELPAQWSANLDIERYLTSSTYDPEVNKYGVACGQSIEQWEDNGWIAHDYDVRGWFQWYCRFWMGRRCEDDERQISRWKKCVGETGRWRRTLLKQYVQKGIRSVFDEGDEDQDRGDVSPVVSQTCLHWAYEVRQDALDRYWAEGK
ncbi:hypothetical protein JX265_001438 [Neoarthrinium moseri]|uniref:Vegetatible incompatibility protein HET-E-1 n=1 Tax=Neoarthrinium moseri TaxID=1658444 RepID=A0A9P9WVF6_9PEZI|nr:uncharacterized protein JN550_009861 [Neoarthrinium moseri]KAI1863125.1 hypothetical protein JN550_009861 [Neoarthrinium moseri]KAI1879817.1 hypothetical protein JX265_001438 [Neoarthrinium moseri]